MFEIYNLAMKKADFGKILFNIGWITFLFIGWCHIGTSSEADNNNGEVESKANKTSVVLGTVKDEVEPRLIQIEKSVESLTAESSSDRIVPDDDHIFSSVTIAPATPHLGDLVSISPSIQPPQYDHSVTTTSLPNTASIASQSVIDPNEVDVIHFDSLPSSSSEAILSSDIHFLEKCRRESEIEESNTATATKVNPAIVESSIPTGKEHIIPVANDDGVELDLMGRHIEEEIKKDLNTKTNDEDQLKSYLEWVEEREKIEKSEQPIIEKTPNRKRKPDRKNYAAEDCGAKIVSKNNGLTRADAILNENKDQYMLNECKADQWVFVLELCQRIQLESVEIANYELFASSPQHISISVSDRMNSEWQLVKESDITVSDGNVQQLGVDHEVYGKYLKVTLRGQVGGEHYCTLSLLRVFGTTEFEMLADEEEPLISTDNHESVNLEENVNNENQDVHFLEKAKIAVLSIFSKAVDSSVGVNNTNHNKTNNAERQKAETDLDLDVNNNISLNGSSNDTLTKDAIVVRYDEDDDDDELMNKTISGETSLQIRNSTMTSMTCVNYMIISVLQFLESKARCWAKQNQLPLLQSSRNVLSIELSLESSDHMIVVNSATAIENAVSIIDDKTSKNQIEDEMASGLTSKQPVKDTTSDEQIVPTHTNTLPNNTTENSQSVTDDLPNTSTMVIKDRATPEALTPTKINAFENSISSTSESSTPETPDVVSMSSVNEDTSSILINFTAESSSTSSSNQDINISDISSSNVAVSGLVQPSFQIIMESSQLNNDSTNGQDISSHQETDKLPHIISATSTESTESESVVSIDSVEATLQLSPIESVSSCSNDGPSINGLPQNNGAKHTPIMSGSKESVLVKLKKKISDLETNLNRSLVYLELMSQKYRKNQDEQQKGAERRLLNLSNLLANTSLKMQNMRAAHAKVVQDMELKINHFVVVVETLEANASSLRQEVSTMAQSFTLVLIMQAIIMVIVMKNCCQSRCQSSSVAPTRRHSDPVYPSSVPNEQIKPSKSDSMICRHDSNQQTATHARKRRNKRHSRGDLDVNLSAVVTKSELNRSASTSGNMSTWRATGFLSSGKDFLCDCLGGRLFTSNHSHVTRSRLPLSRRSRPSRRYCSVERGSNRKDSVTMNCIKRPRSCEPLDRKFSNCKSINDRSI